MVTIYAPDTPESFPSLAEWASLIDCMPAAARRRYCHLARLVFSAPAGAYPPAEASVAAFQQIADRHPHDFVDAAWRLAARRQGLPGETYQQRAERLWHTVSAQPFACSARCSTPPSRVFADALGLLDLYDSQRTLAYPARAEHALVQRAIELLAVALEEASRTYTDPISRSHPVDRASVLAPYPDAPAWRLMIAADAAAARRRAQRLEVRLFIAGRAGPFNLYESIAAYYNQAGA